VLLNQSGVRPPKDMIAFLSSQHQHAPGSSSTRLTWLLVFQPAATCIRLFRISNSSSSTATQLHVWYSVFEAQH